MLPTVPAEFDTLMATCRHLLDEELSRCGPDDDPSPLGMVEHGSSCVVLKVPLSDERAKDFFGDLISHVASELGSERVAMVSSAWLSRQLGVRPIAAEDRQEVVMLLLESRACTVQVLYPIKREPGAAPQLGAPSVNVIEVGDPDTHHGGRYAGLLGRTEFSEAAIAAGRKILADVRGAPAPRPPRLH